MKRILTLALAFFMLFALTVIVSAAESAFEEVWVTAEQEFYDDPETLELGGHGQPIQYVDGYGVGYSSLNDQVIYRDIDFGANGADKMLINFSNGGEKDTTLAIYIDEKSGDPDATFSIPNTGGWEAVWAEDFESAIDVKGGVHDVIIEFTNDNSGSFYYIKFFEKAAGGDAAAADEPAEYKAVGEVAVPYATPEIDGVVSEGEYPEEGKVILNQSNMTALGWVGEVPAENSIELYYAWDKDNFYLAGNVTDPAFEYSNPGQYDMDAFQVSLNIGNVFKTDEGFDRAIFYSWGLQEEGTIDVIRQESANNDTIFEVGKGQKTDTGWCFEVPLSLEMLAED
ncbi:MAG: carbohydrate-binding protein, partial [Ruminococcaceae bacterium]|nr:carbohydrate-binding protein [Oscillospiraceae bacterium]